MNKVLFTASLSNGETIHEEKGNFQTITGELSPWQRLLAFCASQKATITSLALYTADGKRWNIPSAGKTPKFKAFADCEKPISYRFFRKIGADMRADGTIENTDHFNVIEATYTDGKKIQVWVDDEGENSWTLLLKE